MDANREEWQFTIDLVNELRRLDDQQFAMTTEQAQAAAERLRLVLMEYNLREYLHDLDSDCDCETCEEVRAIARTYVL